MVATYLPDSEMVAESWVNSLDLPAPCSTGLPRDYATWDDTGYILIVGAVGGSINSYTGVQKAVISLESYAYSEGSPYPPYWQSSHNLESILRACETVAISRSYIELPSEYFGARILEAVPLTPSRRKLGDQGGYAVHMVDIELTWVHLSEATTAPDPEVPGNPGEPSENLLFLFPTPSMVWTVTHNLGFYPLVSLLDDDGEEFEGEIDHVNTNGFTVQFNQPTSGSVVVG